MGWPRTADFRTFQTRAKDFRCGGPLDLMNGKQIVVGVAATVLARANEVIE